MDEWEGRDDYDRDVTEGRISGAGEGGMIKRVG